ncbi:hypothetical protein M514_08468 [Trichuris suis]|uniref:RCC1-like domain-containing protein n=1 Tax=Trichuris suis TaxID=68888 RepID=A0A085MWH3_9BILA|nr:hypothetical protein M514_08468 [Trichuris suis]
MSVRMVGRMKKMVRKHHPSSLKRRQPRKRAREDEFISVELFLPKFWNTKLLVCGVGEFGQLGLGEDQVCVNKFNEVEFKEPLNIIMVAAGGVHALFLTDTGVVYSCGCNDDGPLGRQCLDENGAEVCDDTDFTFRPVQFKTEELKLHGRIVMITTGDCHCAALTEKGSVFVWGTFRGKEGPIGLMIDDTSGQIIKKAIRPHILVDYRVHHIVKISSGTDHLAMLDRDGSVWTVGATTVGQLGRLRVTADMECTSHRVLSRLLTPAKVNEVIKRPKASKVYPLRFKNVFSTAYAVFALSFDDDVICWGMNNYFQLGIQPTEDGRLFEPFPVFSSKLNAGNRYNAFAGEHHILALSVTGVVYGIGRGLDGRLGLGRSVDVEEDAAKIGPFSASSVCGVAAAGSCSFAWTEDGSGFAWGANIGGLLGLPVPEDAVVNKPKRIPLSRDGHVVQIATNGVFVMMLTSGD